MNRQKRKPAIYTEPKLPYSEIFFSLLESIHHALWYCYTTNKRSKKELTEMDPVLLDLYKPFEKFYAAGINKHIRKGLSASERNKYKIYPRLSKLTIQAFQDSQEITTSSNFKGFVIPSPLSILFQILTVPNEPQTAAYPLYLCRNMIFYFIDIFPVTKISQSFKGLSTFEEKHVFDSIISFRNYIKIQLRWPDPRLKKSIESKTNLVLGHFLSMKSVSHLWFSKEKDVKDFCVNFRKSGSQLNQFKEKYNNPRYRFRISHSYVDLPDPGEIINWLFGVPLPIRGSDVIFFGGLIKTSKGGLVINLSGKPGVGKTSIALAFAAQFAPLGIKTIYVSLEENETDLYKRLLTLIPAYLKELSIFKKFKSLEKNNWFYPYVIEKNVTLKEFSELLDLLRKDLNTNGLNASEISSSKITIPNISPLYIVFDNINELFAEFKDNFENFQELENFINKCREFDAVVVLVSSEEVALNSKIDYLVDTSINLKQIGNKKQEDKPIRIFQLNKSRHQISRQGAHVFHLTGPTGFRLSPQVPSQMDRQSKTRRLLPDKSKIIHALNITVNKSKPIIIHKDNNSNDVYLNIYPNSQLLIHGYGSGGKAGFGLRFLLTPPIEKNINIQKVVKGALGFDSYKYRRKILVVSFLYPEEYYNELILRKLNPSIKKLYRGIKNPIVRILPFFPGYLTPEDFINKILKYLDEAVLEGEPYTGILLDGLHNVFLQFKKLQENDMVWPLLYSILSRYKLTVVTTFTYFSLTHIDGISQNNSSQSIEDQMLMQKGQTPFLHTLVKAADFYLLLEERIHPKIFTRDYILSVRSAIDQSIPKDYLKWDRQELKILGTVDPNELKSDSSGFS